MRESTGLLFPGQGCAARGMGMVLADLVPAAAAIFDLARTTLGDSVLDACRRGGPDLEETLHQQPAVLACELAHFVAWDATNREAPAAAAGHSLGQLAALVVAGAIDVEAAFSVVGVRALAMQAAGTGAAGAMAAVLGMRAARVREICRDAGGAVWVGGVNWVDHVVITGERRAVVAAGHRLLEAGAARVVPLTITVAAHSPMMSTAARRLREAVSRLPIREPHLAVPSNLDGSLLQRPEAVRRELWYGLLAPVQWRSCLLTLGGLGCRRFVELAPRPTLTNLVARALPAARVACPTGDELARSYGCTVRGEEERTCVRSGGSGTAGRSG